MPARKLLDFLKLSSRLEGIPGFSTAALGLSYDRISQLDAVSFDAHSKSLKLRFPLEALPMGVSADYPVSLSTYMAMMDDITTWALVLADSKRGRAGKSVCLQADWNPTHSQQATEEVEFTVSVKKIGRSIGFAGAEVRDVATNELICYGSHVKYMPMGAVIDFALSSTGWGLTKLYSEHVLSDPKPFVDSTDLMESFRLHDGDDATMATFTPSKAHASLGGPIHGGCQAVLMELAANSYVGKEPNDLLRLDSMSVYYMSPPKSKVLHLDVVDAIVASGCEPPGDSRSRQSLRVHLKGGDDGRVKSEGLLHFSCRG